MPSHCRSPVEHDETWVPPFGQTVSLSQQVHIGASMLGSLQQMPPAFAVHVDVGWSCGSGVARLHVQLSPNFDVSQWGAVAMHMHEPLDGHVVDAQQ